MSLNQQQPVAGKTSSFSKNSYQASLSTRDQELFENPNRRPNPTRSKIWEKTYNNQGFKDGKFVANLLEVLKFNTPLKSPAKRTPEKASPSKYNFLSTHTGETDSNCSVLLSRKSEEKQKRNLMDDLDPIQVPKPTLLSKRTKSAKTSVKRDLKYKKLKKAAPVRPNTPTNKKSKNRRQNLMKQLQISMNQKKDIIPLNRTELTTTQILSKKTPLEKFSSLIRPNRVFLFPFMFKQLIDKFTLFDRMVNSINSRKRVCYFKNCTKEILRAHQVNINEDDLKLFLGVFPNCYRIIWKKDELKNFELSVTMYGEEELKTDQKDPMRKPSRVFYKDIEELKKRAQEFKRLMKVHAHSLEKKIMKNELELKENHMVDIFSKASLESLPKAIIPEKPKSFKVNVL